MPASVGDLRVRRNRTEPNGTEPNRTEPHREKEPWSHARAGHSGRHRDSLLPLALELVLLEGETNDRARTRDGGTDPPKNGCVRFSPFVPARQSRSFVRVSEPANHPGDPIRGPEARRGQQTRSQRNETKRGTTSTSTSTTRRNGNRWPTDIRWPREAPRCCRGCAAS